MAIFDELAAEYGLQLAPPVDATQQMPPVQPRQVWGTPPQWGPQWAPGQHGPQWAPPPPPTAAGCPVCAVRDRPQVLLHRHIDQAVGSLQRQIADLEQRMSQALDNANAQLANLTGTINGTVLPALQQLGAAAATAGTPTGVAESDVQALADGISGAVSTLAAATQQAVAQIPPAH